MDRFNEYRTTTNRSVYNKLHKEYHAHCSLCKWHTAWHGRHCENTNWEDYYQHELSNGKIKAKYPSWKLISKNRKQWMKKDLIYRPTKFHSNYTLIEWPMSIRSK